MIMTLFLMTGNSTTLQMYAVKETMATYYMVSTIYDHFGVWKLKAIPLMIEKISLFETAVHLLEVQLVSSKMEELGQGYGYTLSLPEVGGIDEERIQLTGGNGKAQLFIDGKRVATQYQTEIEWRYFCQGEKKALSNIDILIENMGRANYGHKFLDTSEIRTGVCKILHFLSEAISLPLDNPERLISQEWTDGQPALRMTAVEAKGYLLEHLSLVKGLLYQRTQSRCFWMSVQPYIYSTQLSRRCQQKCVSLTEGNIKNLYI